MPMQVIDSPPEVAESPDDEAMMYEYVNGERTEKNVSWLSQVVGSKAYRYIDVFAEESGMGGIASAEPYIRCFDWAPGTSRRPDAAYWRAEQVPDGLPPRGDAGVAPALVVEVVSPGDSADDLEVKLAEYYRAGVELAWIVYATARTVHVEQPDGTAHVYRDGQTFPGDPVLPGLRIEVSSLFPMVKPPAEANGRAAGAS